MAGKAMFDQEAAFKSIIGAGREPETESQEMPVVKVKSKDRVQRSYFLDRDVDKALRRMALERRKNTYRSGKQRITQWVGEIFTDIWY